MKLVFNNPTFDAQLLRTISYTAFGGADISECFETARRITEGDRDSWYTEWLKTADRVRQGGEESLKGGHRVSAISKRLNSPGSAMQAARRCSADAARGAR